MRTRERRVGVLVAALAGFLVAAAFATTVAGGKGPATASGVAVPASEPMDLVWISDSVGWGVARFYAQRIREDLGVAVRVRDKWEGDLTAVAVLQRLRTPGHPWIRLIRNAEVVFVSGNAAGSAIVKGGNCVTTGCQRPKAVGPRPFRPYVAILKAIHKRIFEIRRGKPVIMRSANWYVPVISHAPNNPFYQHVSWDGCGITAVCTRQFECLASAIAKAAAAYGVPVADVYTAFNGSGHREDPVDKGYIDTDGIHVNDAGRAVFAETLAALGYEQVTPPG